MPYIPKKRFKLVDLNKHNRRWSQNNETLYSTTAWRKLSKEMRINNPKCNACSQFKSISNLVLDHIIPINQGGAIWDKRNLQVLCGTCHNAKSAAESNGVKYEYQDTPNGRIPKNKQ